MALLQNATPSTELSSVWISYLVIFNLIGQFSRHLSAHKCDTFLISFSPMSHTLTNFLLLICTVQ